MQRANFIPQITINQINTANQAFFIWAKAKQITLLNTGFDLQQFLGWVVYQIHSHHQIANFAWMIQFVISCRQGITRKKQTQIGYKFA